MLSIPNLHPL